MSAGLESNRALVGMGVNAAALENGMAVHKQEKPVPNDSDPETYAKAYMATHNGIPENGHKAGQACVTCDHRRTDGQTGMWGVCTIRQQQSALKGKGIPTWVITLA